MNVPILVDQVILIHQDQVRAGPLVDRGRLEGAVAAPFQVVFDREVHPTLPARAVKLADGLSRAQAFLDGNKRLAWHSMVAYLALNGYALSPSVTQAEGAQFIHGLNGESAVLLQAGLWLNGQIVPISGL